jgi:hypothetical protein
MAVLGRSVHRREPQSEQMSDCSTVGAADQGAKATPSPRTQVVTVALALCGMALVGLLLLLHPHGDLLQDAFNTHPPTSAGALSGGKAATGDASNLWNDVNGLSTDALYLLMPTVTLAGAVGGIFWAVGARRGPMIVGGAVMAGVIGAGLKVIVQ